MQGQGWPLRFAVPGDPKLASSGTPIIIFSLSLADGQSVRVTDGEFTVDAVVEQRRGYWVAIVIRYL